MPAITRSNKTTIRRVQQNTLPLEERKKSLMVGDGVNVDWGLVIILILLLSFGLVSLFSASMSASVFQGRSGTAYLIRQLTSNFLGLLAIVILTRFNLKTFDRPFFASVSYVFVLMLLFFTYFFAPINGARRWITIPVFGQFQASELMKVVLVYSIAVYFSWLNKQRATGRFPRVKGFKGALKDTLYDIFIPVLITLVPALVTFFQPHFSGMIIMIAIGGVCLLAAGLPLRSWLVAIGTFVLLLLILLTFLNVLEPVLPQGVRDRFAHVETRLDIFTGNEDATEAQVYQSRNAQIAMGSGGMFGVGLGQGKQKHNYLPEGHNDYVFSNLVEENGFVGGMAVLGLFITFFILGLRITFHASSIYAQIVAGGMSSLIIIQALLNIAVNVGVIPPTGISLPFFSYGGTSNLFFLIGIGLLLNVSKYGVSRKDKRVQEVGSIHART